MKNKWVAIIVQREHVKTVKTYLEHKRLNSPSIKIKSTSSHGISGDGFVVCTSIPATVGHPCGGNEAFKTEQHQQLLRALQQDLSPEISTTITFTAIEELNCSGQLTFLGNALSQAIYKVKEKHILLSSSAIDDLLCSAPSSYSIYSPLLLLPEKTFQSEPWKIYIDSLAHYDGAWTTFFGALTRATSVTHVALDAPIPAKTSEVSDEAAHTDPSDNIIRSPENLQPLHGDFGPPLPAFPHHLPTIEDFSRALWVSTRQNGINQCWAPRYTMFSSGNVTEKARLLKLEGVLEAVRKGEEEGLGCGAVDLFAGIGYFAFSYAKAGVSKILCWDINPWSAEGLRRGSQLNKWKACIFPPGASDTGPEISEACKAETKFIVFCESNVSALTRVQCLRESLPPIRHVNCGVLPRSDPILQTALQIIDPRLGGWIHVHESALESHVQSRSRDIMTRIQECLDLQAVSNAAVARLEHIEKVKSMGPRLLHLVLDIWIPPTTC